MRTRLLRSFADTIAVFAVLSALIGSGVALALSALTHYRAELWHFILIAGIALGLLVAAAIIHFATRVYERRCVIRICWNAVKDADALDHEDDPLVDPDAISQKSINALATEVLEELADELPSADKRRFKRRLKAALGAVAVAAPVALTGALIAMQKKMDVYKGKNTETVPLIKPDSEKN